MGVHTLLYWRSTDGAGAQHAFEAVQNVLINLQGVQQQRWSAQAAALRQAAVQEPGSMPPPSSGGGPSGGRDVLQRIIFSDTPGRMFLLAKAAPPQVIEAEASMGMLLERYALSKQRAALQLEGWEYCLAGDLVVRVARAVQAPHQQFLGIVLDVCYQPLDSAGPDAEAVLRDFTEIIAEAVAAAGGRLCRQPPDCLQQYRLGGSEWTARHRAALYAALMSDLAT